MKLRGRTEAPDGAEGAQFLSARGANQEALHGPLQRLLEDAAIEEAGDIDNLAAATGIELPSVFNESIKQCSC